MSLTSRRLESVIYEYLSPLRSGVLGREYCKELGDRPLLKRETTLDSHQTGVRRNLVSMTTHKKQKRKEKLNGRGRSVSGVQYTNDLDGE